MRLKLYFFGKLTLVSFTCKPLAYVLCVVYTYPILYSKDMNFHVQNWGRHSSTRPMQEFFKEFHGMRSLCVVIQLNHSFCSQECDFCSCQLCLTLLSVNATKSDLSLRQVEISYKDHQLLEILWKYIFSSPYFSPQKGMLFQQSRYLCIKNKNYKSPRLSSLSNKS